VSSYYNEFDPFAAAWLRELIKDGQIADGEVDERSIVDVRPDDLREFTQCHFFAGIGGWSYALRLAGWPDDAPVWTGSCPCQPFSSAGTQAGGADPRHLWPTWFRLIRECRPPVVFGEQVESAIGHGWLDLVCDDLEREGYAAGAASLAAPSVGAFHIRQRLWFVADAHRWGQSRNCECDGRKAQPGQSASQRYYAGRCGADGWMAHAERERGRSGESWREDAAHAWVASEARFWDACDWLPCSDGKARPVEPGTFPLAYGIPARVGRLRGYGNAIVPQVAAAFVSAYMDTVDGRT